ncbi:MAG: hypothetical protein FJ387_27760 [Verrucomicrobia bacterium]|nr:hypothetical protein [Verrucomicrobiota bacterium]
MTGIRILALLGLLAARWALPAAEKVAIYRSGPQPGHYLSWRGQPLLLVGDSVRQGWMECGTNFNQTAYVDARGIVVLLRRCGTLRPVFQPGRGAVLGTGTGCHTVEHGHLPSPAP